MHNTDGSRAKPKNIALDAQGRKDLDDLSRCYPRASESAIARIALRSHALSKGFAPMPADDATPTIPGLAHAPAIPIGQQLRDEREAAGLTRAQVAAATGGVLKEPSLRCVENGQHKATDRVIATVRAAIRACKAPA